MLRATSTKHTKIKTITLKLRNHNGPQDKTHFDKHLKYAKRMSRRYLKSYAICDTDITQYKICLRLLKSINVGHV